MAYILQAFNPRAGLRGLGNIVPGGNGSASDPFGGIGGGNEDQLRALVVNGMTFSAPPKGSKMVQTGIANGEKYIYVVGSDKMFYKFKQTGTGIGNTPNDSATMAWFSAVIASAKPPVTATVTSPGPTVTTLVPTRTPGVNFVVPTSTIPRIKGGATVMPGALPRGSGGGDGESKTPWGLIAGGVALLAVGYFVTQG